MVDRYSRGVKHGRRLCPVRTSQLLIKSHHIFSPQYAPHVHLSLLIPLLRSPALEWPCAHGCHGKVLLSRQGGRTNWVELMHTQSLSPPTNPGRLPPSSLEACFSRELWLRVRAKFKVLALRKCEVKLRDSPQALTRRGSCN